MIFFFWWLFFICKQKDWDTVVKFSLLDGAPVPNPYNKWKVTVQRLEFYLYYIFATFLSKHGTAV